MVRYGDTILHLVIREHKTDVAKQMVRLGADVCAKNRGGETPLQVAVVNKSHVYPQKDMVPNGTRFYRICFHEGIESLRMALACRDENTVIKLATQGESGGVDHDLVKLLLDAGADVNSKDAKGVSPLQCAIYSGDVELVKTLLEAGADVNSQNCIGATALHDAVVCCNEQMVHMLLSRGADVAAKILQTKETALHWASVINRNNSHGLVIRHLLEFGSDLNEKSNAAIAFDRTPFIYILMHGDIDLVNLCIEKYKADLDKLTMDGSSPLAFALYNENRDVRDMVLMESNAKRVGGALHCASKFHRPEYVRELIARGGDVNAKNRWLLTPFAASLVDSRELRPADRPNFAEDMRQVIKLLLEGGVDVNQRYNASPILHLAIESDSAQVRNVAVKLIIEHTVMIEERTNSRVFDDWTLAAINEDLDAKTHYEDCQVELAAMRKSKIKGTTITYFFILVETPEVVAWYTKNEEFSKALEARDYQDAYPIYAWWLREKLNSDNPASHVSAIQEPTEPVSTTATTTLVDKAQQCIVS